MDYDKIIKEVRICLQEVAAHFQDERNKNPRRRIGNGEWTKKILSSLYALSKREDVLGMKVSACPVFDETWDEGEWLYDMIWYRNNEDYQVDRKLGLYHSLRDVILVLESEWSHSAWDVQYDFEKLLVAKAPVKVMIVDDLDSKVIEKVIDKGIESFQGGCSSNEIYLIAKYSNSTGEFEFREKRLGV